MIFFDCFSIVRTADKPAMPPLLPFFPLFKRARLVFGWFVYPPMRTVSFGTFRHCATADALGRLRRRRFRVEHEPACFALTGAVTALLSRRIIAQSITGFIRFSVRTLLRTFVLRTCVLVRSCPHKEAGGHGVSPCFAWMQISARWRPARQHRKRPRPYLSIGG